MKQLTYTDYEEFICDATEVLETLDAEYPSIAFIAKYTEANKIIKELISVGYDIGSIELHKEEFNDYSDEYIIELNSGGIWCEKFKFENGYLQYASSITYVMDNCCSKVLKYCGSDFVYEVCVGEEDNDYNESVYINITKRADGTPTGFFKSWSTTENGFTSYSSYSHYNDNVNQLKEIAESFGVDLKVVDT